jgi:hypothetical protein
MAFGKDDGRRSGCEQARKASKPTPPSSTSCLLDHAEFEVEGLTV